MENNMLKVEIVTPQKVLFNGEAVSVTVPGSKSPFQILHRHAPIVSTLEIGVTKIVTDNNETLLFATSSGFTEVHNDEVSILVENAIKSDEIDIDSIKSKMNDLKVQLKDDARNEMLINALKEAENQLKLAEKS